MAYYMAIWGKCRIIPVTVVMERYEETGQPALVSDENHLVRNVVQQRSQFFRVVCIPRWGDMDLCSSNCEAMQQE